MDEVCQAVAHGRVMVCGVRGGVRRGQGAEQIICSGCAAKEEQEECDLRVLNSRDRGQELSLCDVFVVQGRGHIVRVSEGVPRIWSPCALVGKAHLPVQMGAAGGVGCRRWMSVGSSPAAFHTLVLPRWRLMPACASRLAWSRLNMGTVRCGVETTYKSSR